MSPPHTPARRITAKWQLRTCIALVTLAVVAQAHPASAGEWTVTFYAGAALPNYDQTFIFKLSVPPAPGVDIRPSGDLTLEAKGGPVFGGTIGWQAGVFGLEGRVDTADLDLETGGIRFDAWLAGTPPTQPPVGSITIGAGNFDLQRLVVLSLNARLRTPGPVGFMLSGGFSYLPELEAKGTVPIEAAVSGLPGLPGLSASLRLVALPTQQGSSFGGNLGGGLVFRLGPHVSLLAEGRVFGFREFELGYELEDTNLPGLDDLVKSLPAVTFTPVYFHGAAGLMFSF